MLNNAFGMIYTGEASMRLKDLTLSRSISAVPFAGRYRIIDFALSNMVNSGVRNVGVLTHKNYHSLIDHLGSGGSWDLHRKRDGMFLLPPFVTSENNGLYRGTVDAFKAARIYLDHVGYKYCIFSEACMVYNASYENMMKQHMDSGADVTFLYHTKPGTDEAPTEEGSDIRFILSERSRITDMEIDSYRPKSNNAYMSCMIIDKTLLEYLINEATSRGYVDLLRDVIFKKLDTLRVFGYKHEGYCMRINSIPSYFQANMDMLDSKIRTSVFSERNPIYTKVKDEVPALYKSCAIANNSLVADGCVIEGEIQNSVLFRGVRVDRNAVIRNSIIMQDTEVQAGAVLENVILDKDVVVKRDRKLIGVESFPVIVRKGAVI